MKKPHRRAFNDHRKAIDDDKIYTNKMLKLLDDQSFNSKTALLNTIYLFHYLFTIKKTILFRNCITRLGPFYFHFNTQKTAANKCSQYRKISLVRLGFGTKALLSLNVLLQKCSD